MMQREEILYWVFVGAIVLTAVSLIWAVITIAKWIEHDKTD
jgi:hypothetical protein